MNDGIFLSDEELVEEEDETTAAEEVEDSDDGTEDSEDGEEDSDDGGEEDEEVDVRAPAAKKKNDPRDPGWHRDLFHLLAANTDYFCNGEKQSRARKRILTTLREKNIDKTARDVKECFYNWIRRYSTPRWLTKEESAILEKMRKTAERLKGSSNHIKGKSSGNKSNEWAQQLFKQLVTIPDYFEMEDKRSANKKIVDALRKKEIDRTSGQVRRAVFGWIWRKRTPQWMTAEETAALEEMRETAERFKRNSNRKNESTEFGQQLFQQLKNIPGYFEMEDKSSANRKISEALRKKKIDRTSEQVRQKVLGWIWRKYSPQWMSPEETAALVEMRKADERFNRNCSRKRNKPPTPIPAKKSRTSRKRRRVQKTPEVSEDEEERDVALHENDDQVSEGDEQAEDREKENEGEQEGVRFDQEDEAYDFNGLEAYDFPFEVDPMEPMDVVLPPGDVNSEIPSPDRTVDSDESTESLENDGLAAINESSDSEPFDPMDDGPSPDDVSSESAPIPFAEEDSAENDDEFKFQIGASNAASVPTQEKIEALLQKYLPPSNGLPPPIEQKKAEKAPVPLEFRISPDEEEEENPTRVDSLLEFYDQIEKYKKLVAQKDNQILKLEKKIRDVSASKDEELRKFKEELRKKSEENEALKKKLGEVQKRPDEVLKNKDEGEIEEKDVPKQLKPLLELKGRAVGEKYRIQKAIGVGTFGLVFRANHTETKEVSALKVVVDEEVMEEELRVMERMKKFEEKNEYICAPSDFFRGRHGRVEFIAFSMELLPTDLLSFFWMKEHKKKTFPSESVLQILAQLFSALDFLNRHGIVYSDVKPDNLMMKTFDVETRGDEDFVRNPVVRLIDFNAIREEDTPCSLCQTAHLRSPEVILGLDFDSRIDSWSAGILALELLEKEYFFDVEYPVADKKKPYEHLALISFALNTPIPDAMWAKSSLDPSRIPKEIGDQLSVAEVFEEMKPSFFTAGLQKFVAQLLVIDPEKRLFPNEALSSLEDLLPR